MVLCDESNHNRSGSGSSRHCCRVASQLAELKVNIIDISQTLMHGSFTMILMGEWDGEQQSFDRIKTALATSASS